jgi:hypothetical protein
MSPFIDFSEESSANQVGAGEDALLDRNGHRPVERFKRKWWWWPINLVNASRSLYIDTRMGLPRS